MNVQMFKLTFSTGLQIVCDSIPFCDLSGNTFGHYNRGFTES